MTKNYHNCHILICNAIVGVTGVGRVSFKVLVALLGTGVSELGCWSLRIACRECLEFRGLQLMEGSHNSVLLSSNTLERALKGLGILPSGLGTFGDVG